MEELDEYVIKGPAPLEPLTKASLGQTIYEALKSATANKNILVDAETQESLTISELLEKSCSLAEALKNCGFTRGTIISISSENNVQWFIVILASLYVGATIAPINHNSLSSELKHLMNLSKPKFIFCSTTVVDKFIECKKEFPFVERLILMNTKGNNMDIESIDSFIERYGNDTENIFSTNSEVETEEDTAFIMCSSGTTGLPKGVMLTHKNIIGMLFHFRDPRYFEKNALPLCVRPFFNVYGLMLTLAGIAYNTPTIFLDKFEPVLFLKTIENYKIRRLYLAPHILLFLAKSPSVSDYNLSSVTDIICASAPLSKLTEDEFKKRFDWIEIRQFYGLTEATLVSMQTELDPEKIKSASSGKPMPFMKAAIRHRETGRFLGPNKRGEIVLKGELVLKGYHGNPEATRNTFDKNGWLLTGDIGYYDEDEDFFIVDRSKEMIKYEGFQVAPAEIEAMLLTHPDIHDSGVVGKPDEEVGEVPLAFVVKSKKSKICEKDVQDFIEEKLSPGKWLRGGVRFVDAIPRNATGKILRRELKTML